jgi:hypothetical protein
MATRSSRATAGPRPSGDTATEPTPSSPGEDPAPNRSDGRWSGVLEQLSTVAGIVAPTTVLTALLYYYGYVATYARFDYFGVDVAVLRLPTQDLVLRSVAVLYVPCAAILGLGIGYLLIRNGTRTAVRSKARWPRLRQVGWAAVTIGSALLVRAAIGLVRPDVAQNEFPATTPMALGFGVSLVLYGRHLLKHTADDGGNDTAQSAVYLLASGIVVLSLFWAANTFAAAYGRGQAEDDSVALTDRPEVVLDTKERLFLNTACATETSLVPADAEQGFRYRHRGLRLFAVGSDRLLLIPDRWRDGCEVLVVPDDDSVRIQFGR